jgi:hypothetical protein
MNGFAAGPIQLNDVGIRAGMSNNWEAAHAYKQRLH